MTLTGLSEAEKEELYRAVGYLEDKSHPVYSKSVCNLTSIAKTLKRGLFNDKKTEEKCN